MNIIPLPLTLTALVVLIVALTVIACHYYKLSKKSKYETAKVNGILQNIDSYVFLINDQVIVKETNYYEKNPDAKPSGVQLLGNVMRCTNGCDAGHCGAHDNCKHCLLRYNIVKAFTNRTGFTDVDSNMSLYSADGKSIDYVSVKVSGRYVEVKGKPMMVICIKDMTEDKRLLRSLLSKQLRVEKAFSEAKEKTADQEPIRSISEATGVGDMGEKPKILFDTQNVPLYNKVFDMLHDHYDLIYAEDQGTIIETGKTVDHFGVRALILDESFVYSNVDVVDKALADNAKLPILIFSTDPDMKDQDSLHYISAEAGSEAILDKLETMLRSQH